MPYVRPKYASSFMPPETMAQAEEVMSCRENIREFLNLNLLKGTDAFIDAMRWIVGYSGLERICADRDITPKQLDDAMRSGTRMHLMTWFKILHAFDLSFRITSSDQIVPVRRHRRFS